MKINTHKVVMAQLNHEYFGKLLEKPPSYVESETKCCEQLNWRQVSLYSNWRYSQKTSTTYLIINSPKFRVQHLIKPIIDLVPDSHSRQF